MTSQSSNYKGFPGLQEKTCIITGGAGVLGSAICHGLASGGIRLAVLDLNRQAAENLARQIEASYQTPCIGIEADVLNRESLEKARDKIHKELGQIDFLINGAGGNSPKATTEAENIQKGRNHGSSRSNHDSSPTSIFDLPLEGFEFVFDLNFTGTLLSTQVFGADLVDKGSGAILNISSMTSYRPLTKVPAYSAAKASVNNFTQWLAVHLAPAGVRVNAIAPGFFLTSQNRFLLTDQETGAPTPRGQKIIANTPMGKYGQPEDLQGATLFLLSELSSFITGIILPVDGGYSAFGGV
ncbi:MAG: SDR family oxidoreductase [Bacteroidales bacterium]|nr:SDR family oxidoreductase [Bacteroidales bacterium]